MNKLPYIPEQIIYDPERDCWIYHRILINFLVDYSDLATLVRIRERGFDQWPANLRVEYCATDEPHEPLLSEQDVIDYVNFRAHSHCDLCGKAQDEPNSALLHLPIEPKYSQICSTCYLACLRKWRQRKHTRLFTESVRALHQIQQGLLWSEFNRQHQKKKLS